MQFVPLIPYRIQDYHPVAVLIRAVVDKRRIFFLLPSSSASSMDSSMRHLSDPVVCYFYLWFLTRCNSRCIVVSGYVKIKWYRLYTKLWNEAVKLLCYFWKQGRNETSIGLALFSFGRNFNLHTFRTNKARRAEDVESIRCVESWVVVSFVSGWFHILCQSSVGTLGASR